MSEASSMFYSRGPATSQADGTWMYEMTVSRDWRLVLVAVPEHAFCWTWACDLASGSDRQPVHVVTVFSPRCSRSLITLTHSVLFAVVDRPTDWRWCRTMLSCRLAVVQANAQRPEFAASSDLRQWPQYATGLICRNVVTNWLTMTKPRSRAELTTRTVDVCEIVSRTEPQHVCYWLPLPACRHINKHRPTQRLRLLMTITYIFNFYRAAWNADAV